MNYFGVAVFLALGATFISARTTKTQLEEALNTVDKIWTVFRSYQRDGQHGENSCVYAKTKDLKGDDYTFEQGFKSGSVWQNETLYGKLSEQGGEAVLTVSRTQGAERGIVYTLKKWDNQNHCGVLTFTGANNVLQCELHVWEQNLRSKTPPCHEMYKENCENEQEFTVCKSECLEKVA
uniref:Lipocalin-2 1 n=1 Tax=Amblyomma americanum TaxID=6943 RepID=A0A0C9RXL1_AMBAM